LGGQHLRPAGEQLRLRAADCLMLGIQLGVCGTERGGRTVDLQLGGRMRIDRGVTAVILLRLYLRGLGDADVGLSLVQTGLAQRDLRVRL